LAMVIEIMKAELNIVVSLPCTIADSVFCFSLHSKTPGRVLGVIAFLKSIT
jgi:hypothetical protein